MKKICILFLVSLTLAGCRAFDLDRDFDNEEENVKTSVRRERTSQPQAQQAVQKENPNHQLNYDGYAFAPSLMYCENGRCAQSYTPYTIRSVQNYIRTLMQINVGEKISVCEADDQSKRCLRPLSYKLATGAVAIPVQVASASVVDVRCQQCPTGTSIYLDYHMNINSKEPVCALSEHRMMSMRVDSVLLLNQGASCRFGMQTKANFAMAHKIDYVDVDRGIIGAQYEVRVSGQAAAESRGYVLLSFKYASPLQREIHKEPCSPLNPCER